MLTNSPYTGLVLGFVFLTGSMRYYIRYKDQGFARYGLFLCLSLLGLTAIVVAIIMLITGVSQL
ncbi:hypothetical protein [Sulfobacillus thermosulfidooxidans]|uniref:hypothetical protein n=1 Tax=Sulfobacillus thermosulfidooxidans TaxID=28034 RepID=UPI0006B5B356|nr:hypothetical protein [Sulfobacillus thermosulfidooxidans]